MTTDSLEPFEMVLRRARQREDSHNRETLYFPTSYERDLYLALAENASQTVDRIIICGSETPDAHSFHRTIWRDVADAGVESRAVYVLSHIGLSRSGVKELIDLDLDSGIKVRTVAINQLPDALAQAGLTETIIIDRRVSAMAPRVYDRFSAASWTVTQSAEHVDGFRDLMEAIWESAFDPKDLPTTLSLDEPLVQSAPLISGVAPVLCAGDHVDPKGCAWYHGTWQYLRLMDLVSTPTWHDEFYRDSLRKVSNKGARKVLITGTADYSVLAYAIDAFSERQESYDITVVDLCPTPLFACQWYGKRVGIGVETVADDVLRFATRTNERYDLIVTDAFLTRFAGNQLDKVLEAWHGLLNVDGTVITTVRAHSETDHGQTADEAVASFQERALNRWSRWESFISLSRTEVAYRAEAYARRMVSNPIGTVDDIVATVSPLFHLIDKQLAFVPGELYPTKYLRVNMTKRR